MFNPDMVSTLQSAMASARGDQLQAKTAAPGARGGGATTAFAKMSAVEVFEDALNSEETAGDFAFGDTAPVAAAPASLPDAICLEDADQFIFGAAA